MSLCNLPVEIWRVVIDLYIEWNFYDIVSVDQAICNAERRSWWFTILRDCVLPNVDANRTIMRRVSESISRSRDFWVWLKARWLKLLEAFIDLSCTTGIPTECGHETSACKSLVFLCSGYETVMQPSMLSKILSVFPGVVKINFSQSVILDDNDIWCLIHISSSLETLRLYVPDYLESLPMLINRHSSSLKVVDIRCDYRDTVLAALGNCRSLTEISYPPISLEIELIMRLCEFHGDLRILKLPRLVDEYIPASEIQCMRLFSTLPVFCPNLCSLDLSAISELSMNSVNVLVPRLPQLCSLTMQHYQFHFNVPTAPTSSESRTLEVYCVSDDCYPSLGNVLLQSCLPLSLLSGGLDLDTAEALIQLLLEAGQSLRTLDVRLAPIFPVSTLNRLFKLTPNLQRLSLHTAHNANDSFLSDLLQRCPHLTSLDISHAQLLSDLNTSISLAEFAAQGGALEALAFPYCSQIGRRVLMAAMAFHASLRYLNVGSSAARREDVAAFCAVIAGFAPYPSGRLQITCSSADDAVWIKNRLMNQAHGNRIEIRSMPILQHHWTQQLISTLAYRPDLSIAMPMDGCS